MGMTVEQRLSALETAVNTLQSQMLNKAERATTSDALLQLENQVTDLSGQFAQTTDQMLELSDRQRKLTAAFQASQPQ